ncbi:4Fe-4S dicluster domain-containing protein, partial [Myxococcota bacterium]|nr:4Fe-4S dicluster domain-containing protein [Myxococcota bacterium]MBU1534362.1 4Fe-4S dicluster domain-containing protein [Myxococcota bacterium]
YQAGRRGLQRAQEKGMGIAIMEPLRGGYLARPLIPEAQAILDTAPTKRSNAEWAFRWLFNDPGIHVVLSGMNDQSQVEENLRIAREGLPHSLSEEETNIIARVQSAFRLSAEVPCTACRYCMPCPEGVEIPKNLLLLNDHHHLPAESRDALFRMRYGMRVTSEQSAARCTGCGACLSKCPQDIDIPSLMREILRLTT